MIAPPWQPSALGSRLRAERETCGISVRDIARRMGLSVVYVADLERGLRLWSRPRVLSYYAALQGALEDELKRIRRQR